jgi:hypothetical protein
VLWNLRYSIPACTLDHSARSCAANPSGSAFDISCTVPQRLPAALGADHLLLFFPLSVAATPGALMRSESVLVPESAFVDLISDCGYSTVVAGSLFWATHIHFIDTSRLSNHGRPSARVVMVPKSVQLSRSAHTPSVRKVSSCIREPQPIWPLRHSVLRVSTLLANRAPLRRAGRSRDRYRSGGGAPRRRHRR